MPGRGGRERGGRSGDRCVCGGLVGRGFAEGGELAMVIRRVFSRPVGPRSNERSEERRVGKEFSSRTSADVQDDNHYVKERGPLNECARGLQAATDQSSAST